MPKFRIVMTKPNPRPENPFAASLIHQTTPTRTAEIEAESEAKVREFFTDAKAKGFPSVRGYDLTSVTAI